MTPGNPLVAAVETDRGGPTDLVQTLRDMRKLQDWVARVGGAPSERERRSFPCAAPRKDAGGAGVRFTGHRRWRDAAERAAELMAQDRAPAEGVDQC